MTSDVEQSSSAPPQRKKEDETRMKAVILAAGKGTRLADLTRERPKPMVDVGGKPCLERIIEALVQASVTEIVVVTGYMASAIESYFGDGANFGVTITYVHQHVQDGTGSAVHLTRAAVGHSSFLMTYGDVLMPEENYLGMVNSFRQKPCAALLGVNWVDDPYKGAAVYFDADNTVERIVEKPPQGTSKTNWNNAGIYVFDPVIYEYTAQLRISQRGEYELPDAIQAMQKGGLFIRAYQLQGYWKDIGTPEDLKKAGELFQA